MQNNTSPGEAEPVAAQGGRGGVSGGARVGEVESVAASGFVSAGRENAHVATAGNISTDSAITLNP